MSWCDRCGGLVLAAACPCVRFEAAVDNSSEPWAEQPGDGEWTERWARGAADAAEKFAEHDDSDGDYTILKNRSGRVWIRDASGNVTRWDIEAEPVPVYNATLFRPQ